MSLVKINILYDYHATKRVTIVFVTEEELLSESFDEFKKWLLNEIPHLSKIAASLRLTVLQVQSRRVTMSL